MQWQHHNSRRSGERTEQGRGGQDSGRTPDQFQVLVGQGEIEYGRIITQLERFRYDRSMTVDVWDVPDGAFPVEPEVRKLKYLLESLV